MELRPLTQDELLAEAARTELDNLRDLEHMVALEEATKKKAMYKRSKYSGPMIRFHSKRIEEVALVSICTCNWPCVHNLNLKISTFCAVGSKPSLHVHFCCIFWFSDAFHSAWLGFLLMVLHIWLGLLSVHNLEQVWNIRRAIFA